MPNKIQLVCSATILIWEKTRKILLSQYRNHGQKLYKWRRVWGICQVYWLFIVFCTSSSEYLISCTWKNDTTNFKNKVSMKNLRHMISFIFFIKKLITMRLYWPLVWHVEPSIWNIPFTIKRFSVFQHTRSLLRSVQLWLLCMLVLASISLLFSFNTQVPTSSTFGKESQPSTTCVARAQQEMLLKLFVVSSCS